MRCEEAQRLLPELVGEAEPYPHELEVHLATCAGCAAEEGDYRTVVEATRALGLESEPLPAWFVESLMAHLSRPEIRLRGAARRLAHDPRTRYAAASLGGAVVGAAAFALLRRRAGRRTAVA